MSQENPIITESDDDEWYDCSIVDYNELIMLEIENQPVQLSIGGPDNVFVLEEKLPNQQVLSLYQLPDKVIEARQDDVVKSSHLKIKTAALLADRITQIGALYNQGKVIASGTATPGLSIFELNEDEDKLIRSIRALAPELSEERRFCQLDPETLIVTITGSGHTYSCSLVNETLQRLNLGALSTLLPNSSFVPFAISGHSTAIAVEDTGHIAVHDLRSYRPSITIPGSSPGAKWAFSAPYDPFLPCEESTIVTRVSDKSAVTVYDLKYPTEPLMSDTVPFRPTGVRMASNGKYLSIPDARGFVRIYSYSEARIVEVFNHQGHVRMEHCDRSTRITDHLWLSNDTLITSAENKTVNIWQFVVTS